MPKTPFRIVLIGAGNVGYHLGHQFHKKGIQVVQAYSRKLSKARKLAKEIQAKSTNDLKQISTEADIYVIAVNDDAISEVASELSHRLQKKLIVHTSGSVASTILKPYFKNYGCFYPLQTFSIHTKADFDVLPLCIYSPQKRNRQKLDKLGHLICPNIYEINDYQKSILHVAAVFVNNFTNHLYNVAKGITEEENIDFDILKPLIYETVQKIQDHDPHSVQTGPASRGDKMTIQNHLKLIQDHPYRTQLYQLISSGIEILSKKEKKESGSEKEF